MSILVAPQEANTRRRRRLSRRGRAALTLGAVGVVATAGVLATVSMIGPSRARHALGNETAEPTAAIGETTPTSFGFLTVSHVEHLAGLSQQDLSSANHGVANLVESGKEQIEVSLEITSNLPQETAPYSPDQFELLTGTESLAPVTTTIHAGRLQPFASVQGHFGFVVPADGAHLQLVFHDPSGSAVTIDLDDAGVGQADPATSHAGHDDAATSGDASDTSAAGNP